MNIGEIPRKSMEIPGIPRKSAKAARYLSTGRLFNRTAPRPLGERESRREPRLSGDSLHTRVLIGKCLPEASRSTVEHHRQPAHKGVNWKIQMSGEPFFWFHRVLEFGRNLALFPRKFTSRSKIYLPGSEN